MLTITVSYSLFIPSYALCTISSSCEVDTFMKKECIGVSTFHVMHNS